MLNVIAICEPSGENAGPELIPGKKAIRLRLPVVEAAEGKVKFNPLANWTRTELEAYVSHHDLPPHPLVAAVQRGRRSVGLPATTGDGSTDANAALAAGIPAVAIGCCDGEDMHAPTERIRVASIDTGARQLTSVIAEFL